MQTHAAPAEAGTLERNKDVVRRFVAEIFVAGRPEAVDELVADDFVPHSWPSTGDPAATSSGRSTASATAWTTPSSPSRT